MKKFKRLLACLLAVALCCMPVFAVCADGEDNDVVDDWDGTPEPDPEPPVDPEPQYYNGDLNKDNAVDLTDLGIMDKYFLKAVTENDFAYDLADLNGDDAVDLTDLGIMDKYFLKALSAQEIEDFNLPA